MREEGNVCAGCRHFFQHYVRVGNRLYVETECGHCGHPRLKERLPSAPACQRFVKR